MSRCPVCKNKLHYVYEEYQEFPNGYKCINEHYLFLDSNKFRILYTSRKS